MLQFVVGQIKARYKRAPSQIILEQLISHIHYLHWNAGKDKPIPSRIFLMDQDETPVYEEGFGSRGPARLDAIHNDLYFQMDSPYGTLSISQIMEAPTTEHTAEAKVHFLHRAYLNTVAPDMG